MTAIRDTWCPICREVVDSFHWTIHGSRYTVDGEGFVRDISPLEPPIGRLSQGEDDPPDEDEGEDE